MEQKSEEIMAKTFLKLTKVIKAEDSRNCEHQVGKTQRKPYLDILVKMDKTQIQEKKS